MSYSDAYFTPCASVVECETDSTNIRLRDPSSFGYDLTTIPRHAEKLIMNDTFDQKINPGDLPPELKYLKFNDKFNRDLSVGSIPPKLTHLTFGCKFNKPIYPGVLPPSLESLVLSGSYGHELVAGSLPYGLKKLQICGKYSHVIGPYVLPHTLEEFMLYCDKDILTESSLPDSLKRLEIGGWQNYEYCSDIGSFDFSVVPLGLRHLELFANIDAHNMAKYNPQNIEEMKINSKTLVMLSKNMFPANLKRLFIYGADIVKIEIGAIPEGLKFLSINISDRCFLAPSEFPSSLTELKLYNNKSGTLLPRVPGPRPYIFGALPKNLEALFIQYFAKGHVSAHNFPSNLKTVGIYDSPGQYFDVSMLPDSVEKIDLRYAYEKKLEPGSLPSSLKSLRFGGYNHPLVPGVFPATLEKLVLEQNFNHDIRPGSLPDSLKTISLGRNFKKSAENIPSKTKILSGIHIPGVKYTFLENFERIETSISNFPDNVKVGPIYKLKYGQRAVDVEPIQYGQRVVDVEPIQAEAEVTKQLLISEIYRMINNLQEQLAKLQ